MNEMWNSGFYYYGFESWGIGKVLALILRIENCEFQFQGYGIFIPRPRVDVVTGYRTV